MAYGKVQETFWRDSKIRSLSDDARYFMLYLLTCPHRNRLGMFVLDPYYAAADLQWDPKRVEGAAEELVENGRIRYDIQTGILFIIRYLKHNTMENTKVATGAVTDMRRLPDNPYWEDLMAALTQWRRPHYAVVIEALGNRIANESPNDIPNEHANDSAYSIPHHNHSHNHNHNHSLNPEDDAVTRARAGPSAQPAQPDDLIDDSKKLESLGVAEAAIQAFRSIPGRTDEREWGIVTKFGPNGTDERVWAGLSTEERPEVLSNALITLYSESPDRFHPPFFREILRRLAERTGSEQVTAQEEASTEAQRRENIQDWRDEIDRKEQLEDREAAEVNEKLDWLTKQPDDVKQTVEREVVKRLAMMGTNVPEILRRGIVLSVMEEQGINPSD